jgi:chromosome segregation ATPase
MGFSKLVDKLNTRLGECDAQVKERDKRIDELERELEALRTSNHDFRNQVMQLQGKSRGRTT